MAKSIKPKPAAQKKPITATAKKPAGTGLKYTDKSAGQPGLIKIFDAVKNLLLPYEKGTLELRGGTGGQLSLVSSIQTPGKNGKPVQLWFATLLIQKGYVGFYFHPVQKPADQKAFYGASLLKCLKGKSCFHLKADDPVLYKEIKQALAKGYTLYKEQGRL